MILSAKFQFIGNTAPGVVDLIYDTASFICSPIFNSFRF